MSTQRTKREPTMNSHLLVNQMAAEHHRELINEAAGWRRGREARRAARAQAAASLAAERARADAAVYCRRAAAHAAGCTV